MPLLDNGLRIGTGLAIGLVVVILAPAISPAIAAVVRPVAKASIKSAIILYEKTLELIAEAKETVEDLAAEAQAELAEERRQQTSKLIARAGEGADAY
jgi:nucleotide-binding universal stress UspA family protein